MRRGPSETICRLQLLLGVSRNSKFNNYFDGSAGSATNRALQNYIDHYEHVTKLSFMLNQTGIKRHSMKIPSFHFYT